MPRLKATLQERIEADSEPVPFAGCWLWTKSTGSKGYGVTTVGGKTLAAHRISYEAFLGPIPDGLVVMHLCDTPPCVNPAHLVLGTHADNHRDMWSKGRGKTTPAPCGAANNLAKLDDLKVLTMRAMRASGVPLIEIAAWAGVSPGTAHPAVTGKTWKHLSLPLLRSA